MVERRCFRVDHQRHEKIGPLSSEAYRLWVGLVLLADDFGRLRFRATTMKRTTWVDHADIGEPQIIAQANALIAAGLVEAWEQGPGVIVFQMHDFEDHQPLPYRHPSRYPNPPRKSDLLAAIPVKCNPPSLSYSPFPRKRKEIVNNTPTKLLSIQEQTGCHVSDVQSLLRDTVKKLEERAKQMRPNR